MATVNATDKCPCGADCCEEERYLDTRSGYYDAYSDCGRAVVGNQITGEEHMFNWRLEPVPELNVKAEVALES